MLSRKGPSSFASSGKRWDGTVAGKRGGKALDVDAVRLLKTQDVGYVRTMRNVVAKEVARLEQHVVLAAGLAGQQPATGSRKIVFADDAEERDLVMEGVPPDGADDRDDEDDFADFDEDEDDEAEEEPASESLREAKRKLAIAQRRLRVLIGVEKGLEEQRSKMAKTATSGGTTRAGKRIVVHKRKK